MRLPSRLHPSRRDTLRMMLAFWASLSLPMGAQADQADQITFDVVLMGLKAGELQINGKIEGNGYGANGSLATTGILGALRKLRYDAAVWGSTSGTGFTPVRYEENADTPSRKSKSTMVYQGGTPVSVSREPPRTPRDTDLDPKKQAGTVDPLTALYAVLRDVDRDQICTLSMQIFDGARRSMVTLDSPVPDGQQIRCSGEYRRVAGFKAKEMQEKSRFPFTLTYAPTADGHMRVVEISTDTIYGKGRLKRR